MIMHDRGIGDEATLSVVNKISDVAARAKPMRVNHAALRVVPIRHSRHFCRDGDRLSMSTNRKCGEKYKRKWKWSMK